MEKIHSAYSLAILKRLERGTKHSAKNGKFV